MQLTEYPHKQQYIKIFIIKNINKGHSPLKMLSSHL